MCIHHTWVLGQHLRSVTCVRVYIFKMYMCVCTRIYMSLALEIFVLFELCAFERVQGIVFAPQKCLKSQRYIHTYIYMLKHTHTYIYIYIYMMHIHVYVYVSYIYVYISMMSALVVARALLCVPRIRKTQMSQKPETCTYICLDVETYTYAYTHISTYKYSCILHSW